MLKNVKLLSACRLHPEPDRGPGLGPLRPSGSRASCPGSKPGSLPSPTSWVTPAVQEGRVCGFFFFPLEVHHSTGGPISKQSSFRSDTRTAEWIKVWPRPTGRIPTGQRLCTVSRKGGTSPSAQGAPCAHIPPLWLHRKSSLCLSIKPSQFPMLFIHSLAVDKGLGHTIGTSLIKITFVLSPATCKKLRLARVLNSRSYSKHSIL